MQKETALVILAMAAMADLGGLVIETVLVSQPVSAARAAVGCAPGSSGFNSSHGKCFHNFTG